MVGFGCFWKVTMDVRLWRFSMGVDWREEEG